MNPLTDKITEIAGTTHVFPGKGQRQAIAGWRHSQETFDRWSDHYRKAVANFPNETCFAVPEGISMNTFVRILRDIRQANDLYLYDPMLRDRMRPFDDWVVSPDQDGVWFRAPGNKGRPTGKATIVPGRTVVMQTVHDCPNAEQAHALCKLLSTCWLVGPFQFRSRLDPALVTALEIQYNVGFAYDEVVDLTTII